MVLATWERGSRSIRIPSGLPNNYYPELHLHGKSQIRDSNLCCMLRLKCDVIARISISNCNQRWNSHSSSIPLPKPGKNSGPPANLRPIILLLTLLCVWLFASPQLSLSRSPHIPANEFVYFSFIYHFLAMFSLPKI